MTLFRGTGLLIDVYKRQVQGCAQYCQSYELGELMLFVNQGQR